MNYFKNSALALSLGLLSSGSVLAASDATLGLSATLIPAACSLSLENGGNFDFGDTVASQINRNGTTIMRQETTMRIGCTQPAAVSVSMALQSIDTRVLVDLPAYTSYFGQHEEVISGLGLANGHKIGGYMVEVNPTGFMDAGVGVSVLASHNDGPWSTSYTRRLGTGRVMSFGNTTAGPLPVSDLTGTLRVSLGVASDQGLTFEDVIEMEGNATLELTYL